MHCWAGLLRQVHNASCVSTWRSCARLQYEEGSAPALALQATKQRTEKRFANYAGSNLLCGTDGLPHLIADPGLALRFGHAGEVFVSRPAVMHSCPPDLEPGLLC